MSKFINFKFFIYFFIQFIVITIEIKNVYFAKDNIMKRKLKEFFNFTISNSYRIET